MGGLFGVCVCRRGAGAKDMLPPTKIIGGGGWGAGTPGTPSSYLYV